MKNEVIASLLVLTVLAGAGMGYLMGTDLSASHNGGTTGPTSPNVSVTCTVPDEGELLLQVMNSTSGEPIASAPVQGQLVLPACSPSTYTAVELNTALTNATGFVVFGGELGEYHLYFPSFGNYFVDVSMNPGQTACVTLSIPSGETNITYSGMPGSSCQFGL